MINLNKHRIDFGKGDVGIGVIGNTTDSAQLAFYNQSARPIHILKNPDQNPGFEPMEFKEEPFIMSFSNPESIDAVKNNLFCIISTSCVLNIYLFIYSVLADAKSDIIFRNLSNFLVF